ncbi:MAG TPA: hypothetical protein DIT46_01410 [Gemmatimonadetes bacterium]|nr:hypothetical protein [Gemmatimonadota bacterium]
MASKKNFWFQLGHAIERARQGIPTSQASVASSPHRFAEAEQQEPRTQESRAPSSTSTSDELIVAGIAMVADRVLRNWNKRTEVDFKQLFRAAVSGATAALIVDLLRPLVQGKPGVPVLDLETADRLIAGAGQGVVYGSIVEPRVPGPPITKGFLFGAAEYLAKPLGGVSEFLGQHAPQSRLPILSQVLQKSEDHERLWLEHVAFGVALALIYQSKDSKSGILSEGR